MFRTSGPRRRSAPTGKLGATPRATLIVELLEDRILPSVLTPLQVRNAYGFSQINFTVSGKTIHGDGSGQTIAIVDAYDDASIANDTNTFDQSFSITGSQTLYQQYGAASRFLTVAKPEGQPGTDPSGLWEIEEALDVEWAHAIAPGARILLVEAKTNSFTDLMGAVNYARSQSGVVVVSMSWGASEFSGETGFDGYFTTPSGHLGGSNGLGGALLAGGITFVASSGDTGKPANWPATSPNVLAVGGSTLNVSASGAYLSETGWSGSGGGPSTQEREPAYQSSLQKSGVREAPDVAYDGNPSTGFYVYSSYKLNGYSGWFDVGGTSAGAPQWAALIAIADQGRALAGKGSLDGPTQTLPALYSFPSSDFHQILSGSNGYPAGVGYNLVTGRGTPRANLIVSGLVTTTIRKAAPVIAATTPLPSIEALAQTQVFVTAVNGPPSPGDPVAALPDPRLAALELFVAGSSGPLSPRIETVSVPSTGSVAQGVSVVATGLGVQSSAGGMEAAPAQVNGEPAELASDPESWQSTPQAAPVGGAGPETKSRRAVEQFFQEMGSETSSRSPIQEPDLLPSDPSERMAMIGLAFVLLGARPEKKRRPTR